jgi:hypothetical protein
VYNAYTAYIVWKIKYCALQVMDMAALTEETRAQINFRIIESKFPKKTVICLFSSFRSTKEMLEAGK